MGRCPWRAFYSVTFSKIRFEAAPGRSQAVMKDISGEQVEFGTMRRTYRTHTLSTSLVGAASLLLLFGHSAVSKPPAPKLSAPKPKPSRSPSPTSIQVSPQSVILTGAALSKQEFQMCSRGSSQDMDGFWTPTLAQARQLEEDMPQKLSVPDSPPPPNQEWLKKDDYFRQYIGFTRKGKRFIYVNAFSKRAPNDFASYWKKTPIRVDDGGTGFWGMEYDVEKRTFSHLATNGVA